jgi:ABC-type protease/lipase transport system fused ATPase/permease subunit
MYKEAFWTLFFITVITLILQMRGYALLETVIFLIVMDFIALWIYLENRKSSSSLDDTFIKKIENLENACSKISENIGAVSSVLNLEERFNRQREDITSMLEKINEKNLVLEEKLNSFGQFLLNPLRNEEEEDIEEPLETY